MAAADAVSPSPEPVWRERAVARNLQAARSRAQRRVQRYLDAAFSLVDEKGSTDFTIQEVVERSQQSLRGFYEYFDGKDDLVLALLEETVRDALDDIRTAVDAESDPVERLHAFAIRLHEWCDPNEMPRKRGKHNRRAVAEYSTHLAVTHAERVRAVLAPQARLLRELIDAAVEAGAIRVADTGQVTAFVHQTVMHNSFANRLVEDPRQRLTAEETWNLCLHGLSG